MHSALVGIGLGAVVAAQIGPMSLLLIRSTLRGGWLVGFSIGAGIAVIDGLYAAAGAAGAAPLLQIRPLKLGLGLTGAAVLMWLGARTLRSAWRIRGGGEFATEVATPGHAFATALAGTASNPLTIASWAAAFAAASTAGAARTSGEAALLVVGVSLGSLLSVSALTTIVTVSRRMIGTKVLRAADAVAGVALLGFGGALGYATLRDH